MDIPTGTPVWTDLQSLDREAARAFYSELLGWSWEVTGEEFGNYANASAGGAMVAGEMGVQPGAPEMSMWSIYLKTDDIQQATKNIGEAGGQVLVEPMQVGQLGWMGFYTDPTGAAFGLWQPGQHGGFEISGKHGRPCWFEVNTRDAAKARDFYAMLGAGIETNKLEGMDYWTLNAEGQPRCGVLQMTEEWGDLPPHWMVYFAVEDTDAAADRIKGLGGNVHHGPFDTPFGRIAVVADPQGAVFSIVKPTDG